MLKLVQYPNEHLRHDKTLHRPMKKNILFLIIIILILAGFITYGKFFSKKPTENNLIQNTKQETVSPSQDLTGLRQNVMNDVAVKISELSPFESVLGGKWYVTRYWWPKLAINLGDFYVEYEDGHIMRQIILRPEKTDTQINYQLIAGFIDGEDGWELSQGENNLFGQELIGYEYDQPNGEWITK